MANSPLVRPEYAASTYRHRPYVPPRRTRPTMCCPQTTSEPCCLTDGGTLVTCVFVDLRPSSSKRSSGMLPSTALEELFDDVKRHKPVDEVQRFHSDVFEIRRKRDVLPTWPPPSDRRHFTHPAFPGFEFADYAENDDEWGWFVANENHHSGQAIDIHKAMAVCRSPVNNGRDTLDTVTSEDLLME